MNCKKCGYYWVYKGNMFYATCPSCKTSNKTGVEIERG